MLKNEKELQRWFRDYLNDRGMYADKLETPFAKGWPDIYTAYAGRVTWIEMKWLKPVSLKMKRDKLVDKCLTLPTELQRRFLKTQFNHSVGAMVVTGYYIDDEKLTTRKPNLRFVVEKYPFEVPFVGLTIEEVFELILGNAK